MVSVYCWLEKVFQVGKKKTLIQSSYLEGQMLYEQNVNIPIDPVIAHALSASSIHFNKLCSEK